MSVGLYYYYYYLLERWISFTVWGLISFLFYLSVDFYLLERWISSTVNLLERFFPFFGEGVDFPFYLSPERWISST